MSNAEASSSKHKDKERKLKDKERKHKDKGHKSKPKHHRSKPSKSHNQSADGPFEHRIQRMRLSIPPKFSADWLEGAREQLDGMLMRYVGQMGGVLLAHWEHELVDDTVKIINECPFGVTEVQFESIVWAPKVGQVLYGTHSLSSPSHVSLLFAKTFNVSIPLNHIPLNTYEFEHTDAPDEDLSSDEEDEEGLGASPVVHEVGRWKEVATGNVLGSGTERVRFTVIDLQVTNSMLSLTGSLLADPSSAPAMPTVVAPARTRSPSPELPEPPKQQSRVSQLKKVPVVPVAPATSVAATTAPTPALAAAAAAKAAVAEVDTSKMTARELKKHRKELEKAKREERKAKKGETAAEDEKEDADADVDAKEEGIPTAGSKRKAEDASHGERKKKRKD